MILHLDFEFFSPIDIKSAPLDVYANHPDARILMAAYAMDDGPVKVWEADSGPCPELRDGLKDPSNLIAAWNVNYERTVLAAKGMPLPIEHHHIQKALDREGHSRSVKRLRESSDDWSPK